MEYSEKKIYNVFTAFRKDLVSIPPKDVDDFFEEIEPTNSCESHPTVTISVNEEEADESVPDIHIQNSLTSQLPSLTGGKSKDHLQSNCSNTSVDPEDLPKATVNIECVGKVLQHEEKGMKWIYVQPDVPIPILFENIRKNSKINLKLIYDNHSHQDIPVECCHNCPSDYQNAHKKDFTLKEGLTISKEFLSKFHHSFSVENEGVTTFHKGQCDIHVEDEGKKKLNLRSRCKNSCFPSKEYGTKRKLIISVRDDDSQEYLEGDGEYALHVRVRPDRDRKNKRCPDQNTSQKKRKLEDSD